MKLTKQQVIRALQFTRILDDNANLSLTNIALMAALVRTLMLPSLTVHDLGIFLGTVVSYQVKRYLQPNTAAADNTADLQAAVADLQTKVTGLQLGSQFNRRPS